MGCPIRTSADQSLFAAPHGLSQRITSFIACVCQGIHQMPFSHLIIPIAHAHRPDLAIRKETAAHERYPFACSEHRQHQTGRATPFSVLQRCPSAGRGRQTPDRRKTSFSRRAPMMGGQAPSIATQTHPAPGSRHRRPVLTNQPPASNPRGLRVPPRGPQRSPGAVMSHPGAAARTEPPQDRPTGRPTRILQDPSSLHNIKNPAEHPRDPLDPGRAANPRHFLLG